MVDKKKENILDLNKYVDKKIRVKFTGGREVTGVLKGWDTLVNVVLDDCVETVRDDSDPYKLTDATRPLGLVVGRGSSIMLICPLDGTEEIENPWANDDQKI